MDELKITEASLSYAPSYTETFDAVAREGKFLSISSGYPLADMRQFIKGCRDCGFPQFFLIDRQGRAVGWCDIVRRTNCPDDVGFLGVGILKEYRGQGWGSKLMAATIAHAQKRGFREIRLEVRASNYNAIRTYRRLGFVKIAYAKNGVTTDGVSEDVWTMRFGSREMRHDFFEQGAFFGRFPAIQYKFTPSS